MRIRALAVLLTLVSSPLLAAITGTVVDEDGSPLRAVRVRAFVRETGQESRARLVSEKPDRVAVATVETNDRGTFSIETASQPFVELVFDAKNFASVRREAADGERVDTIALRPHAPMTGRVTAGGKPVAGALVTTGESFVVRTDENGRYEVPGSRFNPIRVLHPSYAQTSVTPRPGTAGDAKLTAGVAIRGRVVDAKDQPVANAALTVDGWPAGRSGEDGSFVIEHQPSQWRTVEARDAKQAGFLTRVQRDSYLIRVVPAATFSGNVRDAQGKAVAGALVTIFPPGTAGVASRAAYADAKGRFEVASLAPGSYTVSAYRFGYTPERSEATLAAGSRTEKTLTIEPMPILSGSVIDAEKKPLAGVLIESRNQSEGPFITGPDGRFRMRIPQIEGQNSVLFIARKKEFAPAIIGPTSPKPTKEFNVTMTRGVELQVRLVDQNGAPIAGEPIGVTTAVDRDRTNPPMVICTDSEVCKSDAGGTFKTRVTEGDYDISVGGLASVSRRLAHEHITADRGPIVVTLQRAVTVTGRVVDSEGVPAPYGMQVVATDNVDLPSLYAPGTPRATAGEDGAFVLTGVPAGPLKLVAVYTGSGTPAVGPVLDVEAPANDVEVRAPQLLRISGRVVEKESGRPITDFSVGVVRFRGNGSSGGSPTPFHDEQGQFTLERVPPAASLDLVVTAPGFARATVSNINLTAEAAAQPVEVKMERGASMRVHVTSGGRAVEGARVVVNTDGPGVNTRPNSLTTDSNGTATTDSLSLGDLAVFVTKRGYVAARKVVQVTEAKEIAVEVEMEQGRELRGRVVDGTGRPVANARVEVAARARRAGIGGPSVQSDAEGEFTLEGLDDEPITVTATRNGYISARAENVDPATSGRITLTLERGGTVSGRVTGVQPDELPSVVITGFSPPTRSETTPDASGNFTLNGLPEGRVQIIAMLRGPRRERRAESKSIDVVNGAAPSVLIEFKEALEVTGRVMRDGAPLSDVTVIFDDAKGPRGQGSRAMTSPDGRYQVALSRPGEYAVSVVTRGAPYDAGTVSVTSSTSHDIEVRGTSFRGRVIDATTRAPLSGVTVLLVRRARTGPTVPITTDSDGRFQFDTISAGSYELRATRARYVSFIREIEVSDGGAPDLEVALEHGDQLALRVLDDPSGAPVDRVSVNVRDMANKTIYAGSPVVDDSGAMTVSVMPGRYKIGVAANGYAWQTVEATVPGPEVVIRVGRAGRVAVEGRASGVTGMRLISTTNAAQRLVAPAPPSRFEVVGPGAYTLELLDAKGAVISTRPVLVTPGATTTVALD